jgi:hypothetical protein
VTEPTTNQQSLATDLTDLGLSSLGGMVLEGRTSIEAALAYVERKLGTKERAAAYISDNEKRQENFKWCEKAKFALDHWNTELGSKS